jgi:hypothetical protein
MTDQILESVLAEASLNAASHAAIAHAYPTLDGLLSATLDEIAAAGGGDDEAARLWEVLERRWRSEAVVAEVGMAPATSGLGRVVGAGGANERPASLRVQLRVLALLDVTMRAAGFDPDARPIEEL